MEPLIVLPEIILLDTINAAINFVRADYNGRTDKTKTFLHLLLNGAALERYDLFNQAAQVICGAEDSPRFFQIDLAFNMTRNSLPSAHITLPSEQTAQGNGMGSDENYREGIMDANGAGAFNADFSSSFDAPGFATIRPVFSRNISSTYNIVLMSDNSNEVILLYHFLRAICLSLIPHFHIKGLKNISFGGQDLQPYDGLGQNIHMRALTISLQYDTFTPSIFPEELINTISVTSKAIVASLEI